MMQAQHPLSAGGDHSRPESVLSKHHARQASIRVKSKPMPDPSELEKRFGKVLVSNTYLNNLKTLKNT